MELYQVKKLPHLKRSHKNKTATLRMGENIHKLLFQQENNIQNRLKNSKTSTIKT
jgi:hypothetical protein